MHVTKPSTVSRRMFVSMLTGLTLPALLPAQSSAPGRIVKSARPEDLEMPREGFDEYITPVDRFFVRTHVTQPQVDMSSWRLAVDGHVAMPLNLALDDLKAMPSVELVGVLECAGNGRSFYDPPVAGLQWANGAVGNGRWRGVRLRDVLNRAGIKVGAAEILFDGADVPIGTMPDFQRGLPPAKALHPGTLLAYEMNGAPLPAKHGFPLRAVVPGWTGNSWIKWLRSVRVLSEPSTGFWMKSAYLRPLTTVAPGAAVAAESMTPVTSLVVKSVISSPAPGAYLRPTRPVTIRGMAWSGDGAKVERVDVSIDRGRTWQAARFASPSTDFGWRLWELSWTPTREGHYTVLSRAQDSAGNIQPQLQEWNPSGYLWNVTPSVDIHVAQTGDAPVPADPTPPAEIAAPEGFRETCLVCHEDDVIRQQRLTRAQWDRELNKMAGWGARVTPQNRDALLDYLLRLAGPRK